MATKSFVKQAAYLLDYSAKEVESIMSQLYADQLIELVTAVNKSDRITAKVILDRANVMESEAVRSKAFFSGCPVKVKGKEGVVVTPEGPYDTVGVRIDGHQIMFPKQDVEHSDHKVKLGENVFGKMDIDTDALERLRSLAGIAPQITITQLPSNNTGQCSVVDICNDALKRLEQNIPDLTIRDASSVRQSLYTLASMMNENRNRRR